MARRNGGMQGKGIFSINHKLFQSTFNLSCTFAPGAKRLVVLAFLATLFQGTFGVS